MKPLQKGFSLIELLVVLVIIGVVASIAIPNIISARRSANEGSALSNIRTLHSAEVIYSRTSGGGSFTSNLNDLKTAQLIDANLGSGVKSGYRYAVAVTHATVSSTFTVGSVPMVVTGALQTGTRKFCIGLEGVLRIEIAPSRIGSNIVNDGDCNSTNYNLVLD